MRPRNSSRLDTLLLAAAVLSSACGSGMSVPQNPTVTGSWVGTGVSAGALENWRFNLEEAADGNVTGSFSLRVERLVFSGDLTGTHAYPEVSLDLAMVFFGQVLSGTYRGRLTAAEIIEGEYRLLEDPQTLDLERLGT